MKSRLLPFAATFVVGFLLSEVVFTSAAPRVSLVTTCADRKTGSLRYSGNRRCKANEFSLSWNVEGPRGEQGFQGLQGPRGSDGDRGADGNTLLAGTGAPSAATGRVGDFYIDTSRSLIFGPKVGATWPTGQSLVGEPGPTGSAGAAGSPGMAGERGPEGVAGKSLLSGTGAPSNALGSTGDVYIDTAGGALYGPKADGSWPFATSLIGAQGVAGPTGPTGLTGAPGASGQTIHNGAGNPTSATGIDGDFYIDTATNQIYGPKTSGAWPAGVSLVGPSGASGVGQTTISATTGVPCTDPATSNSIFSDSFLTLDLSCRYQTGGATTLTLRLSTTISAFAGSIESGNLGTEYQVTTTNSPATVYTTSGSGIVTISVSAADGSRSAVIHGRIWRSGSFPAMFDYFVGSISRTYVS